MSIKIYNGYAINVNMSAYSLMNLMKKLSKDCQEVCNDLYHNEVAEFICTCLDYELVYGKEYMIKKIKGKYKYTPSKDCFHSLDNYIDELIEQHSESSYINQSAFDFNCKIKLFPIKNKTLFLLITNKKEYKSIFCSVDENEIEHPSKKYPQIMLYYYYNNSDKPEHISTEDWDLRCEEWKKALRDDEKGLMFNLIENPYTLNMNLLIEKIESSYEKRIRNLAFSKIDQKFSNENKHLIENNNCGDFIDVFCDYSKSEKFSSDMETLKKDLLNIIPKKYSIDEIENINLTI